MEKGSSMLLLDSQGGVKEVRADYFHADDSPQAPFSEAVFLPAETLPPDIDDKILQSSAAVLVFAHFADGRGFSLPPYFISRGYSGKLVASGALLPDQVSLAFQCGFDLIAVDAQQVSRYGLQTWRSSQEPLIDLAYSATESSRVKSIWGLRANADDRH